MSVVILILKIIGIVLASLIGLVLFLLLLVLFVPVRYKIYANKTEDEIIAKVNLSWLLHLLNVIAYYTDDLYYKVRIGLIPVYKSDNLKKSKHRDKNESDNRIDNNSEKEINETELGINKAGDNTEIIDISEIEEDLITDNISSYPVYRGNDSFNKDISCEAKNSDDDESDLNDTNHSIIVDEYEEGLINETENECEDKSSFKDKVKSIIEQIKMFFHIIIQFISDSIDFLIFEDDKDCFIKDKVDAFKEKLNNTYKKIDRYIFIASDERNINIVKQCFIRLAKVLKHIKPKFFRCNLHIGFSDAYSMGKMLSIYSILLPIIHDKIQIVPDYENEVIDGTVIIKGRIIAAVLVYTFVKVYFNKDFRRLKRMMEKA